MAAIAAPVRCPDQRRDRQRGQPPATSTGLRPYRSDSVLNEELVTALTAPNARMNVSAL